MKLKFIGTCSGKVSLNRFHSSILISENDFSLLIDVGDGITKALIQQKIDITKIDSILFTHFHPDHYTGFPSLINQMKMQNRTKPLSVCVIENDLGYLQDFLYHSYIFLERLGFEINYRAFEEEQIIKIKEGISLQAKQNSHLDKYKIYNKENKLTFKTLSLLIESNSKKIFYTSDIGNSNDLNLFNEKIDYLITEFSHINFSDIHNFYLKSKCKKIFITHYDDELISILNNELNNLFEKEKFQIAYDGLEVFL
ncbi:MAG: MBL fold metallo-hydrolase [Ignavibacterium sp.]